MIDELYISPNDSLGYLLIGPIPGADKNNRVTIKPALNKNVLIEGEGQYVLSFGNTNFVTVDGISTTGLTTLTIHAMNNNIYPWNATIDFWNDSDHDIIQNIIFINDDFDGYGSGSSFWTKLGSPAAPDSNTIQNNFIKSAGISIEIFAGNSPVKAFGNTIRNNRIGSETDSLICFGIMSINTQNSVIEYNIIQNLKGPTLSFTDKEGIQSYQDYNCVIRNNLVHDIYYDGGQGGAAGIGLFEVNNSLVYNNIIYDLEGHNGLTVVGLFITGSSNTKFYFNTVYLTGNGRGTNCYGSDNITILANCKYIDLKNNIFINLRDESPFSSSCLRIKDRTNLTDVNSDYNLLYYLPNQYNCIAIDIYRIKYYTLESWQLKEKDLHSYLSLPAFNAEDSRINYSVPNFAESGGFPIASINYDIDGELRHPFTPDIGADEFNGIKPQEALLINPDQIDFGNLNCGQISDTISIILKNRNQKPIDIYSITNKMTEFKLVDLPALPISIPANDSLMFRLYFHPLSTGTYSDEIIVTSNDQYKPKYNILLKGNVSSFGTSFQSFYDNVNAASTQAEKNLLVDNFLNAHTELPLIENSIVIFIYKVEANCVSVISDINYWTDNVCPMYRIAGTDLWFRAHTFEMDARIDYKYCVNNCDWLVDERNPLVCPSAFGDNSELAMLEYIDAPEIEYYPDIPHGFTYYKTIISYNLGNTRTVFIYTPPGYNAEGSETYPIILFHDGADLNNIAKTNNVFDYLIDKKKIQPLIGVFVPPVERDAEYADDKRFLYEAFIIDELMPFIDSTYRTKKDPEYRAMLGISFGGLITTQICYNHPEDFGLAAPYSASYRASGMSVYNSVFNGPKKDIKWCIDWGKYEPTIVITSVKLRDSLINKGYELIWNQWHEGHSWGSWRAHLDNALEYFFPSNTVEIEEQRTEISYNFYLSQNYPNPFNPSTKIRYTIPTTPASLPLLTKEGIMGRFVTLKVYDALGREVATLVNEYKTAGNYEVEFNVAHNSIRAVASGVYFYQLKAGDFIQIRKMILLK